MAQQRAETKNMGMDSVKSFFLGVRTRRQLVRYLATGISSFVLEYILFYMLFTMLGVHELISNSAALATVFWFNFLVNRFWSFGSREGFLRQLVLYLLLFFFNMGMSNLLIHLAGSLLMMSPLVSKVLTMGLIVCWNFVIYKKVIYRR